MCYVVNEIRVKNLFLVDPDTAIAIKNQLKQENKSYRDLAKELNLSPALINRVINGRYKFDFKIAEKFKNHGYDILGKVREKKTGGGI